MVVPTRLPCTQVKPWLDVVEYFVTPPDCDWKNCIFFSRIFSEVIVQLLFKDVIKYTDSNHVLWKEHCSDRKQAVASVAMAARIAHMESQMAGAKGQGGKSRGAQWEPFEGPVGDLSALGGGGRKDAPFPRARPDTVSRRCLRTVPKGLT